jgi:aerobic-type carbon monoxide dehydrogenase small subunit (CoxS/CutS family)
MTEAIDHESVTITVNGVATSATIPVDELLIDLLRRRLSLTGTKVSCASEVCGACTVLVDGHPVSSCTYLAVEADGRSVTTVEGLADGDVLTPLQEAFARNVGAQCGYCTSGQLMAATALLAENPSPTYADVSHWMSGNICRCGCYPQIAASIIETGRAVG